MAQWVYLVLGVIDVCIQLSAAFFALRIYTYNQLNKYWLAVPIGFVLMGARRILAISYTYGYFQDSLLSIQVVDSILIPLVITLLLFFGILSMYNNFQNFSLLEKGVTKKVKSFKKTQKQSKA